MTVIRFGKNHDHNPPTKDNVINMLYELVDDIKNGNIVANKAIVIFANDTEEFFDVGFRNAGCTMTKALAMCRVGDTLCQQQMGYIPDPDNQ